MMKGGRKQDSEVGYSLAKEHLSVSFAQLHQCLQGVPVYQDKAKLTTLNTEYDVAQIDIRNSASGFHTQHVIHLPYWDSY